MSSFQPDWVQVIYLLFCLAFLAAAVVVAVAGSGEE